MPAPSELHEAIENDIQEAIVSKVYKTYGSPFDDDGVFFTLDHLVAKTILQFYDSKGCYPDFYIDPNDGKGIILGEEGEMKNGKWKYSFAEDNLPIRIMRVGFDRSVGIMNPRFSRREVKITKIIQHHLWEIEFLNN